MKHLPVAELQACMNTRNANRVTVRCGTRLVAFAPGELLLLSIRADPDGEGGWQCPVARCCRLADLAYSRVAGVEVYEERVWPDYLDLELSR